MSDLVFDEDVLLTLLVMQLNWHHVISPSNNY